MELVSNSEKNLQRASGGIFVNLKYLAEVKKEAYQ